LFQNQNPSRITHHQVLNYGKRGGYTEPWIKKGSTFMNYGREIILIIIGAISG
jgi:hypothetical protein